MNRLYLTVAKLNNVVLVSRRAYLILNPFLNVINVFLKAPETVRIHNVMAIMIMVIAAANDKKGEEKNKDDNNNNNDVDDSSTIATGDSSMLDPIRRSSGLL